MAPSTRSSNKRKADDGNENNDHMADAENAFNEAFYTESGSSDGDTPLALTTRGKLKQQRGRKPKRPRLPTPVAPPVSDDERDEPVPEDGKIIEGTGIVKFLNSINGPQLTINLADVIANVNVSIPSLLHLSGVEVLGARGKKLHAQETESTTLTDLPTELSIKIYRLLFATPDNPIMFTERRDFMRSSQILRTCRKIYDEGRLVLYGENSFHFTRAHKNRGAYFEENWDEVGYKDVRRFLTDIGPQNIAKLKYVSFEFEDALPSLSRLDTEGRKYVNDTVLIEVISMLAKHAVLEKFVIGFRGKCTLTSKDYFLMRALCSIRCYEFSSDIIHGLGRIKPWTFNQIKALVEVSRDPDDAEKRKQPKMFKDIRRPMMM